MKVVDIFGNDTRQAFDMGWPYFAGSSVLTLADTRNGGRLSPYEVGGKHSALAAIVARGKAPGSLEPDSATGRLVDGFRAGGG